LDLSDMMASPLTRERKSGGTKMAIIYKIDDYRKNSRKRPVCGSRSSDQSLMEQIGPVQIWASDEEKCRVMMEQAEREEKA